jgi:hypothetical protein
MTIVVVEVDELRHLICDAVKSAVGRLGANDEWVDGRTSPLGRRAFLELAREGAFPASRVGNKLVARRSDVDAYIVRQRIQPKPSRRDSESASSYSSGDRAVALNDDPVARALAAGRLKIVKAPG